MREKLDVRRSMSPKPESKAHQILETESITGTDVSHLLTQEHIEWIENEIYERIMRERLADDNISRLESNRNE